MALSFLLKQTKARLGDREIWVMRPDGEQARKVFDIDENGSIGGAHMVARWTTGYLPSGRMGLAVPTRYFVSGDLKGGPLTKILPPFDPKRVSDFIWLPDGRMIYSLGEPGFKGKTCNLWQISMDPAAH